MTNEELHKLWTDKGQGMKALKSVYQQGRADAIEEFVNFCINDWKMEQAVVITEEKTDCFRIGGYLSRLLEQFKDEFATK